MSKSFYLIILKIKEIADVLITNHRLKANILKNWIVYYHFILWRISESNRWPPACKAGALASWANPPKWIECGFVERYGWPAQIWTGDLYIISVAL